MAPQWPKEFEEGNLVIRPAKVVDVRQIKQNKKTKDQLLIRWEGQESTEDS